MDVTDVEEEDTIRRLCREVSDELEALTERAVQQIRSELPAYSAVPVAEQGNYIRKQLSAMLCAVAENETITTEDTDRKPRTRAPSRDARAPPLRCHRDLSHCIS